MQALIRMYPFSLALFSPTVAQNCREPVQRWKAAETNMAEAAAANTRTGPRPRWLAAGEENTAGCGMIRQDTESRRMAGAGRVAEAETAR